MARLIERLEGSRRSYRSSEMENAGMAWNRITVEHVETAMAEFKEVALADHPELHVEFVRREVMETFLPRYARVAAQLTAKEERGYGIGFLYGVMGRLVFGMVAVAVLMLLPRMHLQSLLYPMMPLLFLLPFLPDVLRWAARRQYRNELQEIVSDMAVIQERSGDYEPLSRLRTEEVGEQTSTPGGTASTKETQ